MRCIRCKSIWVCWNWLETSDYYGWGHECWNCAYNWYTSQKVSFGMPYFILNLLGDYFVEPGRFERELTKDMEAASAMMQDEDENDI